MIANEESTQTFPVQLSESAINHYECLLTFTRFLFPLNEQIRRLLMGGIMEFSFARKMIPIIFYVLLTLAGCQCKVESLFSVKWKLT